MLTQVLAHFIGDYLLQSSWMATKKFSEWYVACAHAFVYSLVFLLLDPSLAAWTLIFLSHALIDHYRLVRYVLWLKDRLFAPIMSKEAFKEFTEHGMPASTPPHVVTFVTIVTDNLLHILINAFALYYL